MACSQLAAQRGEQRGSGEPRCRAHVASYDDKDGASAAAEAALLIELGLNARSQVIDLGAGTGQFALALAPSCARVVAVDVSPVMLKRLRDKVTASAVSNVEVVDAGFLTYEPGGLRLTSSIPGGRFTTCRTSGRRRRCIGCTSSFALVASCGFRMSSTPSIRRMPRERIEQWSATLPTEASDGGWVRADLEEHVRDEHSTFTWLFEPMLQRCGFRIEHSTYTADGIFAEYVARAV